MSGPVSRVATIVALVVMSVVVGAPASADPAPPVTPLPAGFHWGVASSGFQFEGDTPDSNWRRYVLSRPPGVEPIGDAVDFLHRYREDIDRARALGLGVFRVSVEWARLEPSPGQVDPSALAFYDDLIATIVRAGMTPMITLDHWVYPGWEQSRGGWRGPTMVADWLRNARRVVDRYSWAHPMWVTVNEPSEYIRRELITGNLGVADIPTMSRRLVEVHRTIHDHIKRRDRSATVLANTPFAPLGIQSVFDAAFLDHVQDKLDMVGVDYYLTGSLFDLRSGLEPANYITSDAAAEGMFHALRHVARKYPGKPLYVVENSLGTDANGNRPDGYRREDSLRDTIYYLQRAREAGIPVVGYNYWGLTNNYEWGTYRYHLGLYSVDTIGDPTLRRVPTPAVAAYREIVARNGVAANHRPTRPHAFCALDDIPTSCLQPAR